jgi:hypothetical protein
MTNRARSVGLVVVAAVALGVLASSAAGSPVFYTKVEVGATASTPVKFSGTFPFPPPVVFEGTISKTKMACELSSSVTGEVTGSTSVKNVVITFRDCRSGNPSRCTTAGEVEGTIKTDALEGELGDVTPGVPGLRLFDEATGRGGVFASFTCMGGAIGGQWRGSFIGQLYGASGNTVSEAKFAASHKLTYAQKGGIQKVTEFVGEEAMEQLEGKLGEGSYELTGIAGVATFTSEGVSNLGFTK